MNKSYFCYSCGTKSTNFYTNKKTGVRTKYCLACYETYSTQQRNQNTLTLVKQMLHGLNTEGLL